MKFKNLMIVLAVALAMVACKGDESGAAKEVAGTYKGKSSYSIMGVNGDMEMNITLKEKSASSVDLTIPAKSYTIKMPNGQDMTYEVPDVVLADIKVTGKDGAYTIEKKEFTVQANGMSVKGDVQGTVNKNTMVLNYNMAFGAMPMPIPFTFTGTK